MSDLPENLPPGLTPDLRPGEQGTQPPAELSDPAVIAPRIPNLGHALLFLLIVGIFLFLADIVVIISGGAPTVSHAGVMTVPHPKLQIAAEAGTYFATLLTAWFLYPLLWHRSFLDGLGWRWPAARDQALKLIPLGVLLGLMSAVIENFVTTSKPPPITDFFVTPSDAWLLTIFGVLVAPVFEEICFRGFLVPAFAIAYDWLSLPRTPQARTHWQTTTTLTPISLIFAAILSSILFAALHGQQVDYAWSALLVLFSVSLLLTYVRIRTQSVAASALVHAAYNSLIFVMTIIGTGGYRHLDRLTQ